MIWEILLWLSVHALRHGAEVWAAAIGCGLVFLVVQLNVNENTPRAVPMRQAVWRAFKVARALHGLIVVAALVIVNSACMLLTGWWKEWLAYVAVAMAAAAAWRWLPVRRRQPTT